MFLFSSRFAIALAAIKSSGLSHALSVSNPVERVVQGTVEGASIVEYHELTLAMDPASM